MSLIIWNDSLSVGINSIDDQHKKLVQMLNTLYDALEQNHGKDVIQEIFEGLTIYTNKHFAYEEELFTEYNYPESASHIADHDTLIEEVMALKEKLENGDKKINIKVMSFLKEWLTNHILKTDMACSAFLKSKGVN